MNTKTILALTAILWSMTAGASPALLGIEPGITTVGEFRKHHTAAEMIASKTSEFGGPIYRVDGESTGAEDVVEARYIFNRNGVPVAMPGVFNERKFEHINLILGTKYRLMQHSTRPLASHGQQRFAWYDADDVLISLTQPKDSPFIYLTYADQRTRNAISASLAPTKTAKHPIWDRWNF